MNLNSCLFFNGDCQAGFNLHGRVTGGKIVNGV